VDDGDEALGLILEREVRFRQAGLSFGVSFSPQTPVFAAFGSGTDARNPLKYRQLAVFAMLPNVDVVQGVAGSTRTLPVLSTAGAVIARSIGPRRSAMDPAGKARSYRAGQPTTS